MHHIKKVGTNVGNPHSCTTNIMLNSITYKLVFDDVINARQCVRNASKSSFFHLYAAYAERDTNCHVVILNAARCGNFVYDKYDVIFITEGCKKGSFDWSFDIMTQEELDFYIDTHKK